jgi:hypothetical protein
MLSLVTGGLADTLYELQVQLIGLDLAMKLFLLLPYSRLHETEADMLGIKTMVGACVDPRVAPQLWNRMSRRAEELQGNGARLQALASTHPSSVERRDALLAMMNDLVPAWRFACPAQLDEFKMAAGVAADEARGLQTPGWIQRIRAPTKDGVAGSRGAIGDGGHMRPTSPSAATPSTKGGDGGWFAWLW